MDQKNTIVKCKAHPDCLFNYNGVCDNYVINIGTDGKCECHVETENAYAPPSAQENLEYTIKLEQKKLRGQQAKCNLFDDVCDLTFCEPNCIFCTIKQDSYYCTLKKCEIDGFGFMCSKYKEAIDEV